MQQQLNVINARQVIQQLRIPYTYNGRSLRDLLADFGLQPTLVVNKDSPRPSYLYDQAAVIAATPQVRQKLKQRKAELKARRRVMVQKMRGQSKLYKQWCERIYRGEDLTNIVVEIHRFFAHGNSN